MAVTYNKVNWDEDTPVDAPLLDNMDVGIDEIATQANSNESKLDTIQGSETEVDGRITTNESKLDTIQGSATSVDGRITNLEGYVVGGNVIFKSLREECTFSDSFTTLKEFLFGRKGNIRLTFETAISVGYEYVYYRILVDGSIVASGDHTGTSTWISYTEDISINAGSNVKFQLKKTGSDPIGACLKNVRVKVGNSSDNIIEL